MESRGIYLRVASFLRANHAPIEFEYPHSSLTINLHGEVLESEIELQGRLAYMTAFASLHAHPQADLDKAVERTNELYKNAFYSIPYYDKLVVAGNKQVSDEALAMAKRYREVFGKKEDKPGKAGKQF